jgi:hypothetical protein
VLALFVLRDGLRPDTVLISSESLQHSLPWSAAAPDAGAHNRFLGDQPRIFYPYLREAAAVYAGQADSFWTSRGGGGLPFLGNMTSSLFHPLTLLAAVFRVELVPLLAALILLVLGAQFTFLFLRRLGLSWTAAVFGGLGFGFGGHQVLWMQYALAHTLLALPMGFWAVERLVEDRGRRRLAIFALSVALLVFGGHPETGFVAGATLVLWALFRLWDAHGRFIVISAVVLGLALSAIQWLPFVEYAQLSHGMWLRKHEAENAGGMSFGAAFVFAIFLLGALALLRSSVERGFVKRAAAILSGVIVLVMARRMGMSVSAGVAVFPGMYGSPLEGGLFTGAQDFPGLNSGYVGVLPALLLTLGAVVRLGGSFVRFFAVGSLLLWGAAFHMPAAESLVRAVPGMSQLASTRLLGPVAFMVACGGAMVLDILCARIVKPGILVAVGRLAVTLGLILVVCLAALRVPVGPHGGLTIVAGLLSPAPDDVFDGTEAVDIRFPLAEAADELLVMVDGSVLHSGRASAAVDGELPMLVRFAAQRAEEGRHRLRVEAIRDGVPTVIADQPLVIRRERKLALRDILAVGASLLVLVALCSRRRAWSAALATGVIAFDVIGFSDGYNVATPVEQLFPPTQTTEFLAQQEPPFRIFTEGNIMPPDTQFMVGVDHVLSYDNLGYHRMYQWLLNVPMDMDAFASFSFSRANVDYASQRFDALDVRYVITSRDTDLSDIPGMTLAHESETRVWLNGGNLGRAFVVGRAMNMKEDTPESLRAADPADTALLEMAWDQPLGGTGTARIVEHMGSTIRVRAECSGPALLVLAENRGPGWKVSVDQGPELDTMPCDVAWQAVALEAGTHDVVFRLDSPAIRWGRVLSIAAAGLCLLMLLLPRQLS